MAGTTRFCQPRATLHLPSAEIAGCRSTEYEKNKTKQNLRTCNNGFFGILTSFIYGITILENVRTYWFQGFLRLECGYHTDGATLRFDGPTRAIPLVRNEDEIRQSS